MSLKSIAAKHYISPILLKRNCSCGADVANIWGDYIFAEHMLGMAFILSSAACGTSFREVCMKMVLSAVITSAIILSDTHTHTHKNIRVLHGDEGVVWAAECLSEDVRLLVQLDGDVVVSSKLPPYLGYLVQVQFQSQ